MLFNSYEFVFLYLPIALGGFFSIARKSYRFAAVWLGAVSLFYYGWWNPQYVLLLLASVSANYAMGYAIGHSRSRTGGSEHSFFLLSLAVTGDLLLLAYFKYANFFLSTASQFTGTFWSVPEIVLPLGISFFTFTQIAYLVDVHRGIAKEYDFIHYLLFVTYFPHLIAGPVLHHKQMMPQFGRADIYSPSIENINIGLTIFAAGLFKKVILADQFALYANPVFNATASGSSPALLEAWTGALAYTLQLYFDFSGYSDMAIGLSRMFNVKLPLNFDSPYKAGNIIDFWRRWHMTLSEFLRDYLYVPLGGNRRGKVRRYVNLFATMVLGGLWHGAGWTFMLWGSLHGMFLIVNHAWRKVFSAGENGSGIIRNGLGVLLTFCVVVIAWVPFRSADFGATFRMLAGMIGANGISLPIGLASVLGSYSGSLLTFKGATTVTGLPFQDAAIWLSIGLVIVWLLPNTQHWMGTAFPDGDKDARHAPFKWRPTAMIAMGTGAMLALSILGMTRASQFLYFQF